MLLAESAGRWLEPEGNFRPRGMIVTEPVAAHAVASSDRTRLTGRLHTIACSMDFGRVALIIAALKALGNCGTFARFISAMFRASCSDIAARWNIRRQSGQAVRFSDDATTRFRVKWRASPTGVA